MHKEPDTAAKATPQNRTGPAPHHHPLWDMVRDGLTGVVVVAGLWVTVVPPPGVGRPVQFVLGGLLVASLLTRKRHPWIASATAGLLTAAGWWLSVTDDPFVLAGFCLFAAAERYGTRRFPGWLLASEALLLASILVVSAEGAENRIRGTILGAVVIGTAWVLGVRTRAVREETANRVRAQERLRLSRDVHDVLSHTLGAIGVRAGVVAHVSSSSEADLRSTLQGIEGDARSALTELQSLLRNERAPDEENTPMGNLRELVHDLAQTATNAGITTHVEYQESADHTPTALGTTAYRVAQEAVTNVIRHSKASTCTIRVTATDGALQVHVEDNGPSTGGTMREGHGITGMRERVNLVGGALDIGTQSQGFRVHATLPTHTEKAQK